MDNGFTARTAADGAVHSDPAPLRFLVVDDERTNLLVLDAMLGVDGHRVIQARNGEQAVAAFQAERPDMVLMDVMMPGMDGYEATRRIKAMAGSQFVPVIFLTALQDEVALSRCIEAGGDDFLTKPYNRVILRAKINALLRTRELYRALERQHQEILRHHQRLQQEQATAERVFSKIVHRGCLNSPYIKYLISPAALFNGDLLLAARRPSGGLLVMLGDFAGHGLPAAVGAIPVSEIFYVMAAKGYSVGEIVDEIHRKLCRILPVGLFLAACLIEIDAERRSLAVWNGGVPDVLVRSDDGNLRRLPSRHMPLGIVSPAPPGHEVEMLSLVGGERIYLYTDGLIEARNAQQEPFGPARLEEALCGSAAGAAFDQLCARFARFRANLAQQDDITFIEISPEAVNATNADRPIGDFGLARNPSEWRLSFELSASALRAADPLPAFLHMIMDLQGIHEHRERIYLVLAELFNNALEHGLLRLDSAIKDSPEGFAEYYAARERALNSLTDGSIRLAVHHVPTKNGGRLSVHIEDSGQGFRHAAAASPDLAANTHSSGRGLALLRSLCREVTFHDSGNHVEAVYEWPG